MIVSTINFMKRIAVLSFPVDIFMSLIIQKIPHEDQSFFVVLIFQTDGPENKNWTSPPSDLGNHVFSIYLIMDASEP